MSFTITTTIHLKCDCCSLPAAFSNQSAKAARIILRQHGWTRERPNGKGALIDVCPDCSVQRIKIAYAEHGSRQDRRRAHALRGVVTRNARKGVAA